MALRSSTVTTSNSKGLNFEGSIAEILTRPVGTKAQIDQDDTLAEMGENYF
jgi:hypothetical protein